MSGYLLIVLAALGLSTALLSALLVPFSRIFAQRIGLLDYPGERKLHLEVTPYGGGIAIYFSFMAILLLVYFFVVFKLQISSLSLSLAEELAPYFVTMLQKKVIVRLVVILAGATLMFVTGLLDDFKNIKAGYKLLIQIAAALLLYFSGIRITLFFDSNLVSLVLTVLWVVGITNAMNLLDNMDGLSVGVGAIASFIFLVIAIQAEQFFVAALLAVFLGSLLGFLPYNFSPASIFMGDSGSLFLGFVLASLSISGTYYRGDEHLLAVVMPVVVLAIPLFDTTSVMVIRWKNKQPLMQGDKNHFSHRLLRLGMSVRETVLTVFILSATLGLSAVLLTRLDNIGAILVFLHTIGILTVISLLELAAWRSSK